MVQKMAKEQKESKSDKSNLKEELGKRKGWIKARFAIEVLAVKHDVADSALEHHVKKLSTVPGVFAYNIEYSDTVRIENPQKGIDEAFSKVVELELLFKDVFTLLNVVMVYGPSSVEIIEPEKIQMSLSELQNTTNLIASVIHQFAAAGVGGIVVSPAMQERIQEKKK